MPTNEETDSLKILLNFFKILFQVLCAENNLKFPKMNALLYLFLANDLIT